MRLLELDVDLRQSPCAYGPEPTLTPDIVRRGVEPFNARGLASPPRHLRCWLDSERGRWHIWPRIQHLDL